MSFRSGRVAPLIGLLVATATLATPVAAAGLPLARPAQVQPFEPGLELGHSYRRYRHRDNGIDGGDVLAGVVVLGAIAALAGAFGDGERDEPRRLPEDVRYDRQRGEGDGLGRAVDMCVAEAERDGGRVERVEDASRDASGWHVSGTMGDGTPFDCSIGNDGRIRDLGRSAVRYDAAVAPAEDRQYADAVYARLRAGERAAPRSAEDAAYASEPDLSPAYPGGPYPGEPGYDDYARGN